MASDCVARLCTVSITQFQACIINFGASRAGARVRHRPRRACRLADRAAAAGVEMVDTALPLAIRQPFLFALPPTPLYMPGGPGPGLPTPAAPCQLCCMAPPTQQIITGDGHRVLVCVDCALPARHAAHHGITLHALQLAHAAGALQSPLPLYPTPLPIAASASAEALDTAGTAADSWPLPLRHTAGPAQPAPQQPHDVDATAGRIPPPGVRNLSVVAGNISLAPGRSAELNVPSGHKICNLCGEVHPLHAFPSSGERVKPYCSRCMPAVRRSIQLGIRVPVLRQIYNEGGWAGVTHAMQSAGAGSGDGTSGDAA